MKQHPISKRQIKTRFAPSPTGYLHVGGARTALYAWLFARCHDGQFVLRIEDTDRQRSTQQAIDAILEGMEWLGLDWDEGPYFQSKRLQRYQEVVQQLLESGHAYRCTCSKERLQKLREEQIAQKIKPRYDGQCRDCNYDETSSPFVVRFKTPTDGEISFDDLVHGTITVSNQQLDDLVIMRSDGYPTYHLSVVVDDWDTEITHVIRGDDHINNTPRQIHMLQALAVEPPVYAHVPMILGADGKRLSKRHGAVSVLQYRDDGILAPALLNYLVRLGWSHGDMEIISRQLMQELFDVAHISRSPAAFDDKKLHWLNQHYMKEMPIDQCALLLQTELHRLQLAEGALIDEDCASGPALEKVAALQQGRAKTLLEMAQLSRYFYADPEGYDAKAQKQLKPEAVAILQAVLSGLKNISWDIPSISEVIHHTALQFEVKLGKVAQPLRAALTGGVVSPPIDATMQLLCLEVVEARIKRALQWIENN